jgi:hypothetical protein
MISVALMLEGVHIQFVRVLHARRREYKVAVWGQMVAAAVPISAPHGTGRGWEFVRLLFWSRVRI